jgi:hypothetical protein
VDWVRVAENRVLLGLVGKTVVKLLSPPSFGGEVKLAVLCRSFAARKRTLNITWKSALRQNSRLLFLAH